MRTLHVDPAPHWRGGERQVFLLTRELVRRGDETVLAAAPGSPLLKRARDAGIPVEPVAVPSDLAPAGVTRLARLLRQLRPDLLHLHTARAHAAGGLAARLCRFHPVLVTRRLELPARSLPSRWKYRLLADHYIAISRAVADALDANGVPRERVTRIPSGIELPKPDDAAPQIGERPLLVGTLAAFTRQKGPEAWFATVDEVCRRDSRVRFVWAGEGELARWLQVRLERAGHAERVSFPGFSADPESFWRSIRVFFLPSAFEALGTVFLDAMARGIPVVATRVGGIPEIIEHGREGLLADAGDIPSLAAAVLRLVHDEEEARRCGRAGRQRANEFAIEGIVDRIQKLYGVLLEQTRKGSRT
jgi:glycosyltransferase involved in cell wall biosynthesis